MFKLLLGLVSLRSLWQSTTKSVTWKTWGMSSLLILEARSLESRCQQDWLLTCGVGRKMVHDFFYILSAAWQSLAFLGWWQITLSLHLHPYIFFVGPSSQNFFSYKNTSHWLEDLPFTSEWSHLKTSCQFLSSCFQIRFQSQVLGFRISIYLFNSFTCLLRCCYWHLI